MWTTGHAWKALIVVLHGVLALSFSRIKSVRFRGCATAVSTRSPLKSGVFQMRTSAIYDPFESEPLKSRVNTEINTIRGKSASEIKSQLSYLNISSQGVVDKSELDRLLAVSIVKNEIKVGARSEERQERARQLRSEVTKISIQLTDEEVVKELHKSGQSSYVTADTSRSQMDTYLALSRLGISDTAGTDTDTDMSAYVSNENGPVDTREQDGILSKVKRKAQERVKGVKGTMSGVANSVNRRMTTKAEYRAREMVKEASAQRAQRAEQVKMKSQVQTEGGATEAGSQGGVDVDRVLEEVRQLSSFDDVVQWGGDFSRAQIVQLLEGLDEHDTPAYAPRSALLHRLADAVMIEKSFQFQTESLVESADGINGLVTQGKPTTQIGTGKRFAGGVDGTLEDEDEFDGDRSRQKRKRPISRSRSSERLSADEALSEYAVEKELFGRLLLSCQKGVAYVSEGLVPDAVGAVTGGKSPGEVFRGFRRVSDNAVTSSISTRVGLMLRAACGAGADLSTSLGRWAGGDMLDPAQTLFLTSSYCLLRKKGPVSFMGFLVMVRLARIIINDSVDAVHADADEVGATGDFDGMAENENTVTPASNDFDGEGYDMGTEDDLRMLLQG